MLARPLALPRPAERRLPRIHRIAVLGSVLALTVGLIAFLAVMVPVRNLATLPAITGGAIRAHWAIALAAGLAVLSLDAVAVELILRRRPEPAIPAAAAAPRTPRSGIPLPLRVERTPRWAVAVGALVSAGVLTGTRFLGLPTWEQVTCALVPLLPLFVFEEVWKYRHYGFYAVFLGLAALQVGHLGEHTVQVAQLLMYHGDLSRSHGVFGALDFETVHFVWDTLIWVAGAVLISRFRHNAWLWISWIVASVHQVEHSYLFWIYKADPLFWARGGIAGIFGRGGVVGSPLARPYLHFLYNFVVVGAMLVALWDETGRVRDRLADP